MYRRGRTSGASSSLLCVPVCRAALTCSRSSRSPPTYPWPPAKDKKNRILHCIEIIHEMTKFEDVEDVEDGRRRREKYLVGGGAAPRVCLHFKNQASVLLRPCISSSAPVGFAVGDGITAALRRHTGRNSAKADVSKPVFKLFIFGQWHRKRKCAR